jgi:hypothetical protein
MPRLIAVVVFVTPPFWLQIAMILQFGIYNYSFQIFGKNKAVPVVYPGTARKRLMRHEKTVCKLFVHKRLMLCNKPILPLSARSFVL